ncbi:hypothetical protein [Caballeronia sp. BCC1704]|uniref:hypothetical protein n=1 Tax=Caballeronia sp. BCC1704 TaxID=2676300 RepID=UPI00158BA012|nr:hypothetical protein [Caballeronia sp. BCC1704]
MTPTSKKWRETLAKIGLVLEKVNPLRDGDRGTKNGWVVHNGQGGPRAYFSTLADLDEKASILWGEKLENAELAERALSGDLLAMWEISDAPAFPKTFTAWGGWSAKAKHAVELGAYLMLANRGSDDATFVAEISAEQFGVFCGIEDESELECVKRAVNVANRVGENAIAYQRDGGPVRAGGFCFDPQG